MNDDATRNSSKFQIGNKTSSIPILLEDQKTLRLNVRSTNRLTKR